MILDNNTTAFPRIGRQVSHYKGVDLENICAYFDGKEYRYGLYIPFLDDPENPLPRTQTAAIVLKNPSSADAKQADKTIRTACAVIYESFPSVKELYILNLFSLRATDASDVQKRYELYPDSDIGMVGKNILNTNHFQTVLQKADFCVCAWGGPSAINPKLYSAAIDNFWKVISGLEHKPLLVRKAEKGNDIHPFHACYWPHNDEFTMVRKQG